MNRQLHFRHEGAGEPLLVLLHGLGATGGVWDGLSAILRKSWPSRWLIPDLPGHGSSDPLGEYTFTSMAKAVAKVIPPADRIVVLGHSLGGVIGLRLASRDFDLPVDAVIGLGIKVSWSQKELKRAHALAQRPRPVFDTHDAAAALYLKQAGLTGLVPVDSLWVDSGVEQLAGGLWTVRFDQRAFDVGAPNMAELLPRCRARVVLAAGEHDPMCTSQQLRALVPDPAILPGVGHNAHVEDPETVYEALLSR